jgi:hypothetical protein
VNTLRDVEVYETQDPSAAASEQKKTLASLAPFRMTSGEVVLPGNPVPRSALEAFAEN